MKTTSSFWRRRKCKFKKTRIIVDYNVQYSILVNRFPRNVYNKSSIFSNLWSVLGRGTLGSRNTPSSHKNSTVLNYACCLFVVMHYNLIPWVLTMVMCCMYVSKPPFIYLWWIGVWCLVNGSNNARSPFVALFQLCCETSRQFYLVN